GSRARLFCLALSLHLDKLDENRCRKKWSPAVWAKSPVIRSLANIAAVALLASTGAQAADALVPTKAPPFVAAYSWSGLYVGGHVGAGFSYRNWMHSDGSLAEAGDAAMLGGQIGLNHQVGKWEIGDEGHAHWGNQKDDSVWPDGV